MRTLARLPAVEVRGPGAFFAYLRQVLLNRLRDEIRARIEIRVQLHSDMADPGPSPLDQVIGRETLDRYDAALARLRECERDAVVGRVELGCSYEELMPLLAKPSVDATRMAVGRALVRLAQEMGRG
jgi:DNA-directed RNA polymerase specialized sigma24 family protein